MPDDLIKILVAATSGIIGGFASAFFTARYKLRELEAEERAKNQLQYLNPLRVAAMDLRSRLENIRERIEMKPPNTFLKEKLEEFQNGMRNNKDKFASWANGEGLFALSSLYLTMIYFARAARIRTELPFVRLSAGDDRELLNMLSAVRESLGGEWGIWEPIQDSLGDYMRKEDGGLLTYREFCNQLVDESSYDWFYRVIDFYYNMDQKTPIQRKSMIDSLQALEQFLAKKPGRTRNASRAVPPTYSK